MDNGMEPLRSKPSRRLWLALAVCFIYLPVFGYFAYETFMAGKYVRAIIGFFVLPVFWAFAARKPSLYRYKVFLIIVPVLLLN